MDLSTNNILGEQLRKHEAKAILEERIRAGIHVFETSRIGSTTVSTFSQLDAAQRTLVL
jgi:hypothetical protein